MGNHLIDGKFQSDKYPTCPRGKVPLSTKDLMAKDLLWEYAQRRRRVDAEFSDDLELALLNDGYTGVSYITTSWRQWKALDWCHLVWSLTVMVVLIVLAAKC